METKEFYEKKIKQHYKFMGNVRQYVKDILKEKGGSVTFDWESCEAPSYASGKYAEDLTDVYYITKIYLDGDLIKADLHAYYLGDDLKDVDLCDEVDVDWVDILDNLKTYTME